MEVQPPGDSRVLIGIAGERCHPTNILLTNEPWKGRVLYTGPEGIRNHRVSVEPEHRYVGIGTMTREGTSETEYLWRAAPRTPFPRPRTHNVGEIGWSIPQDQDWGYANTGRQIMLGHFRQETEDRNSHLYQNPWYPGPNEKIDPHSDAALVMNVYQNQKSAGKRHRRLVPASTEYTHYNNPEPPANRTGETTDNYLNM